MTSRRSHKLYLAFLTVDEIGEVLTEACHFLDAGLIAKAVREGCDEDELRVITREIWLNKEDGSEGG